MGTVFVVFTFFCVVSAINIKNNACPSLFLYPVAGFSSKCYGEMVKRRGYDIVTHTVVTHDGYILNLFEIFNATQENKNFTVFIQHGILVNSGVWVNGGPRSLAFYFADLGYRVWLGNVRGTLYSNKHVNLTINDPKFWDFNLDTLAAVDIRTMLTFIAKTTRQKIHYIGHSMGTTVGLMFLASSGQEGAKLLQSVSLMSPVVYINNLKKLEPSIIPAYLTGKIFNLFHVNGFLYHENAVHRIFTSICKLIPHVCYQLLITVGFGKTTHFSSDDLLLYFNNWPGGISFYQIQHYVQIMNSKMFQKFDYGAARNLQEYGSEKPPVYDLSKIKLPVCLFYGKNDVYYGEEVCRFFKSR
ncbi:gastric triacylglycerol lipase-like [Zophobas morio]|uniref:gastric triacylglycerol lipase-like n=1 Tax=Zophobas morio TaxID=2755281 RepID=UPI003082BB09